MKRRPLNVFSLSFIDCICCGLGAVILLFVIANARSGAYRESVTRDLQGEVDRLEREVLEGRKRLADLRNAVDVADEEQVTIQGDIREASRILESRDLEIAAYQDKTLATRQHADRLKTDIRALEAEVRRLRAGSTAEENGGSRIRSFPGEGDRQYLTDLKVGGRHIVILLDASASMLDPTIVGVIRRRHLTARQKLAAAKWRRALATVDWLTAQLPPDGNYQIYTFNETVEPVLSGTTGQWLHTRDGQRLNEAVERLYRLVPEKGTSLVNALEALGRLRPAPDNVFLVTDGLPTLGAGKPWREKVSGAKRLSLFRDAVKKLPDGIPVNVILFPLEGDPAAASAYWQLATRSRGSFFSPSPDWP